MGAIAIPLGRPLLAGSSSLPASPSPKRSRRAVSWAKPIWPCSRRGLPCPGDRSPGGEPLPHHFTLTLRLGLAASLRAGPFDDACSERGHTAESKGGIFSVALSVHAPSPARALGVTQRPALRSPGFPPVSRRNERRFEERPTFYVKDIRRIDKPCRRGDRPVAHALGARERATSRSPLRGLGISRGISRLPFPLKSLTAALTIEAAATGKQVKLLHGRATVTGVNPLSLVTAPRRGKAREVEPMPAASPGSQDTERQAA